MVWLQIMWAISANDHQNLILIKSDETLDLNNLKNMLGGIYIDNQGAYASYNRFADLSAITNINIDLDTLVSTVKTYREVATPENDVKIAVYIPFGVTHSLAQTYGLLAEDDNFKINILSSIDRCAEYLHVDKRVLQQPPDSGSPSESTSPFLTLTTE